MKDAFAFIIYFIIKKRKRLRDNLKDAFAFLCNALYNADRDLSSPYFGIF